MLRAKDVMKTGVVTVGPETTIEALGRLFIEKGISGAPVVDAQGELVGIVTENDLIRQNRRFHIPTVVRLFDAIIPLESQSAVEKEIRLMSASTVADICSKPVITVDPDMPVDAIVEIMTGKGVHLIPVLSGGKIVGIIGKMDLIRGSLGEADKR